MSEISDSGKPTKKSVEHPNSAANDIEPSSPDDHRDQAGKPNTKSVRKAAIYTKKGDSGLTSLVDGKRVPKFHSRVHTYGEVDELNAVTGVFKQTMHDSPELRELDPVLFRVQNHLFNLGSLLACEDAEIRTRLPKVDQDHIGWLEEQIDLFNAPLPVLKEFILPGGHEASAWAHVARTVCRRAERQVAGLVFGNGDSKSSSSNNEANATAETKKAPGSEYYVPSLIYLNRLSDFFFTAARWIHHQTHSQEVKWDPQA